VRFSCNIKDVQALSMVDDCLTRTDKISVRNLQAQNLSLHADFLTANAAQNGFQATPPGRHERSINVHVYIRHCGYRVRDDIHRCPHLNAFPGLWVRIFWARHYVHVSHWGYLHIVLLPYTQNHMFCVIC